MLGAGQVQGFVTGDQADNFGVTFHQLALGKSEGAGEAYVEADCFQRVDAHQAQVQLLFQGPQVYGNGFAVHVMRAFAHQMPVAGRLDQLVVVVRNAFRALLDLLIGDDIVKHHRRIVHDVADDVGVRAGVDRLGERPGLYPGFQLRNRDQRQQRHVWTTALDGVQQRLVLQVAEEDVLFVFR